MTRFVDVHAALDDVAVTCAGTLVASHQRCWATHQSITDPAHVVAAAELRGAYQARTAATRGPQAATGTEVGQRSLSHYDEVFGLPSPPPRSSPGIQLHGWGVRCACATTRLTRLCTCAMTEWGQPCSGRSLWLCSLLGSSL